MDWNDFARILDVIEACDSNRKELLHVYSKISKYMKLYKCIQY